MTPHKTPIKYLHYNNTREHQSKLQKACEKENVTLEYTTPYTPQLNGVIERRFAVIKEGALEMLLNDKLNDTAKTIMWVEPVHTC